MIELIKDDHKIIVRDHIKKEIATKMKQIPIDVQNIVNEILNINIVNGGD